jgi:hypothetical protein
MAQFSEKAERLLRKAGWYPGRNTDISGIVEEFQAIGCELFPVAREFLEEFAFLEIAYIFDTQRSLIGLVHFDPIRASGRYERVEEVYAQIVGKPLCIIGELEQDVLMMDPEGRVYNGLGTYLFLMNYTWVEAMNNMFSGEDLRFEKRLSPPPDQP